MEDRQGFRAAPERLHHNQGTPGQEFFFMPAGFVLRNAETDESADGPAYLARLVARRPAHRRD